MADDWLREVWSAFRERNPEWEPKEPDPTPPPKRSTWVSPAFAKALWRACLEVERWEGCPLSEEVSYRLHRWPETGGWSLPERIILAEVCWMQAEQPSHGGGKGDMYARLDHWLSVVDERFSLPDGVEACQALGSTHVNIDWDGSFEPYTLRLPGEERLRNPSVRVLARCSAIDYEEEVCQ